MHFLVIGAGTAGMPFAIEAADRGARVTVIDKADRVGGTLHWSTGQMAAGGTALQKAAGIEDSPALHFEDAWRIGHERANPVLLRRLTELAPGTIEWLIGLGMRFSDYTPHQTGHEPYRIKRSHTGEREGLSILDAVEPALQSRVARGAIELRLGIRATRLLTEDGAVIGADVTGPRGPETIRANAVVLATGGYSSNVALRSAAGPKAVSSLTATAETSTGDGLLMALDLGGRWVNRELFLAAEGGLEDPARPGHTVDGVYPTMNPKLRPPAEIWVNQAGQRFVAEDEPSPFAREHALLEQPDCAMWIIFDAAILATEPPLVSAYAPLFEPYLPDRVRGMAERGDLFTTAATLRALAERNGVDSAGLEATVDEYNRAIAGNDPLGRRYRPGPIGQPPFYALMCKPMTVTTSGGLEVDDQLRVVTGPGPIPGLYAIGEVCGGALLAGDNFVGGMSVTGAISFGRWLARTLTD